MQKSWKDIFFTPVEENNTTVKNTVAPQNTQIQVSNIPVQPLFTANNNVIIGVIDDKFIKHFETILADANVPGPDYYEFKQAINNMAALSLDEATKYKVAFATLSTQGLTKDKITSTLNEYIKLINDDKATFDANVAEKITADIASRDNNIKINEDLNLQYAHQIDELSKKINENNQVINTLRTEQAEIKNKINNSISNYTASQNKFLTDLTNDVQKINTYLS